jgi:hypothetical protein
VQKEQKLKTFLKEHPNKIYLVEKSKKAVLREPQKRF